ncbi:methylated-DNA--[protein]-cysteine S-methyltransferase [uncultured Clostridium sp.]|uniref:methylated-DNA--[protein]-cysteine S-methyltransferase n=1 Tax=uncultured Clostridium sp. TaxID=59620 RepID=UPI0025F6EA74|nr:methylated-DNA--[protein]-cysteine S-methyltransferase [uncultured Clostridium sp.]
MVNTYSYDSDFGRIIITEENKCITEIIMGNSEYNSSINSPYESDLIKNAYNQLQEYFSGKRKSFDLPLAPKGTDFQKKVWKALQEIPYGSTCSYKDIAVKIGNKNSCRAVGNANNKNPIFIVIPCHRVIGANGSLVGYGGGLDLKKKLLDLEKNNMC